MTHEIALLGSVGLVYAVYSYILLPAFFSPLASIPTAHWSCSVSGIWILLAKWNGVEEDTLLQAHSRLGDVVRVAPNTVSIAGLDAIRAVYQGTFVKPSLYGAFNHYGKRMISNIYSKSYVQSSETARAQIYFILFRRLLPLLEQEATCASSEGTDVQPILMAMAVDVISAYILGRANSTDFLHDRDAWDELRCQLLLVPKRFFWVKELPGLTSFLSKFGTTLYPKAADEALGRVRRWNKKLCDKAHASLSTEPLGPNHPADEAVVLKAYRIGLEKAANEEESNLFATSAGQRESITASEIMDQIVAGHSLMTKALVSLVRCLSQFSHVQDQLRQELLKLEPSMEIGKSCQGALPDAKELDALPVLHAVIMETLRLESPVSKPLSREVPFPSCQIGQHEIPGGVRIEASPYVLHHAESAFPDPTRWDHTRWLEPVSRDEYRIRTSRQFWAFGSGGRRCVASHFTVNGIYTNFKTQLADEHHDGRPVQPPTNAPNGLYLRFTSL
ncbi:Cytochrome P450 [Metarhizium album ARSEF 1941]|uniref:Cytochrome P450 n=1 Tax=Metarhizium album (strain ARSEF 1941) TaxID=1081103 RepID=A0A0B2WN06_METAS|nr:Cytochrome P450 [Metarhizium album ARSEF 1941]KHN97451.1 Cytochrome P450 [Metarhizium album ARSEF 1941]